jgi:hypothetical protein
VLPSFSNTYALALGWAALGWALFLSYSLTSSNVRLLQSELRGRRANRDVGPLPVAVRGELDVSLLAAGTADVGDERGDRRSSMARNKPAALSLSVYGADDRDEDGIRYYTSFGDDTDGRDPTF